METGMKWDDTYTYQSSHECYKWYDLLAGEGTDTDELLGYVRENLVNGEFMACINENGGIQKKFDNLEDAKAHTVAYYVTQKLEGV
jgi:hypothetical protein